MTKATESKTLKPVYLIYGKEKLLLEEALDRLKSRLVTQSNFDLNYDEFDGEMTTGSTIVQAVGTFSFTSGKRVVVVKNVDKLSRQEQLLLADYAKHPSEEACLVLVATKVNKGSKIFKVMDKQNAVYEYKPPSRNRYPLWIQKEFRERNKTATQEAAKYLLEKIGYDLQHLSNEIEKISLYYDRQKKIEASDIAPLVERTLKSNIFDFVDSVGNRDREKALNTLNSLLNESDPAGHILFMLVRQFRLLLKIKVLLESGTAGSELAQRINATPFETRKCQEQSKNFTQSELKEIFKFFLDADVAIKRGQQEPNLVLESLVLKIC